MSPVTRRDKRAANAHGYEVYTCAKRLHHGADKCPQESIKRDIVDEAIYAYFETVAVESTRCGRLSASRRHAKLAKTRR
jgi:hypothetical protein